MLLLRSALYLVSGAFILHKYYGQLSSKRKTKAVKGQGHAFSIADEMPLYGGREVPYPASDYRTHKKEAESKVLAQIYGHITYPPAALKSKAVGTAVVAFEVEVDGSITGARVVKDPGHGLGKAALQAVVRMAAEGERWRPGYRDDIPARIHVELPIKFTLPEPTARPA